MALDDVRRHQAAAVGTVASLTAVGIGAYVLLQRSRRHQLANGPGPWSTASLPDGAFDAVIVGAGPSGSTTAFYLAKDGASVALLDKEKFPRDKFCGDAVCTPAIKILEDMGVLQELRDANEVKFADNGGFVSPSGLSYIGPLTWPILSSIVDPVLPILPYLIMLRPLELCSAVPGHASWVAPSKVNLRS